MWPFGGREPLSQVGGLAPNNRPKNATIRQYSMAIAIGVMVTGLIIVMVVTSGELDRMGKHPVKGVTSDEGTGGSASAHSVQARIGNLRREAGPGPPPQQPPQPVPQPAVITPGQKVTQLAHGQRSQDVSPTQQLVEQAWVQYVSGVIAQTQKLDDQQREALAAGLVAKGGGLGIGAGSIATTPASFTSSGSNPLSGVLNHLPAGTTGDDLLNGGGAGGSAASAAGGNGGSAASVAAEQKASYLGKQSGNPDYLPDVREDPVSRDVLRAGAVIPAETETGIDSDLPGEILARVTSNVLNTPDGGEVLVPQGALLVGTYDNNVSNGQERVLVVWNRIIYPDGSSLDIQSMPGTGPSGYAGFHDLVNNHYLRIFGDAILLSVFSAGVQLSQPQATAGNVYSSQQVVAGAMGQQLGQTGENLINRDIGIAPTLKIRPGYRFNVLINRDLVIRPWESVGALSRQVDAGNNDRAEHAPTWVAETPQQNGLAGWVPDTGTSKPVSLALPPAHGGGAISVGVLPVPPGATSVPSAAPAAPVRPVPPPLPTWSLSTGELVGQGIAQWGENAGWHVIWNVGQDWPVPRAVSFSGSFQTVAGQVIEDLAAEGASVRATFYAGNHTLVVMGESR